MSIVPHEKQREYFMQAIKEIQQDFETLAHYASETEDLDRKKYIEGLKAKFKINLNIVQGFRDFDMSKIDIK